ncbi:MAG TPA: tRNA (adenosine(37)-N6)-threonylcarbamoyltransferase complex transferase subunit TsaD [Chlamydiales bacterium]|nr:tRNA (adenosine(37)-N6)-threonylcarbamoyltransferase complex transferase subunit TsaD [Chlamydiales bacterium]
MLVLGIESTCDETGAAVVEGGRQILSNVVASSADIHERYGGVFPELACRRHIDAIIPVIDEAMQKAGVTPEQIDLIAVAKGPGLVGALLIGMNAAKGLSIAWQKPLIGVNHVEGHLYASMMELDRVPLPALGVVLSGGHTLLLKILDIGSYEPIGTTVDDAVGEAFDKVASLLGLPYPGGPHIERIAKMGNPKSYPFSAGKVKKNPFDFSFSGLKTAVLYAVKGQVLTESQKSDVAASFQETALTDIVRKAHLAAQTFPCQAIFLGGGVCNNQRLRAIFHEKFPEMPIFWPPHNLSLDNAAMIAGLGGKKFIARGQVGDPLDLEVQTRVPLA